MKVENCPAKIRRIARTEAGHKACPELYQLFIEAKLPIRPELPPLKHKDEHKRRGQSLRRLKYLRRKVV